MKSVINKVVLGIIWLIAHIIFLVLLIIFTIHQIMTEQYSEWITVLLICDCTVTILTVIPVIYLRDWLNELHRRKDLQAQVDSLEITNIALQAGYDDAEKDRLYWVDKYKEAEHRAEVTERALKDCIDYYSYSGLCPILDCNYNKACWRKKCTSDIEKYFMIQAEKELEEGKDE